MPVTFTTPIPQPSMAKATIGEVHLDPETQTAVVLYYGADAGNAPIQGGNPQRLTLTFAALGLTKAGVYNAVLAAAGLSGTVT
jgi:hypothetical protein